MKVALQLYSIKDISEKEGLLASLDKAKALGYDGVEFAGLFGLSPEQVKEELDKRGLECAGFHEGWENVFNNTDEVVRMAKICNAYSLCIPIYRTDSIKGWEDFAKKMNEAALSFKKENILFGYHNHRHEFVPIDGKLPIDAMVENFSDDVFFEMDTRHVIIAGADPTAYAKKYAKHIPVLHARDTDGETDCAVGYGKVDFEAIADILGVPEWYVVENENFGTNEKELADSSAYLRKTFSK